MSNLVSFKVYLYKNSNEEKTEVRRLGIEQDVAANYTYLVGKLKTIFPCLQNANRSLHLYWKDSDGDEVAISSDGELIIALTEMEDPIKKIYIKPIADSRQVADDVCVQQEVDMDGGMGAGAGAVHLGVICDGCDGPVVGFRYKCVQCPDYDLCTACEANSLHSHHLVLRIPNPAITNRISTAKVCSCGGGGGKRRAGQCGRGADSCPTDKWACPLLKKHGKRHWKHGHGGRPTPADCSQQIADAIRESLADCRRHEPAATATATATGRPNNNAAASGDASNHKSTTTTNHFDLVGEVINILPSLLRPLQGQGSSVLSALNDMLLANTNTTNDQTATATATTSTSTCTATSCESQEAKVGVGSGDQASVGSGSPAAGDIKDKDNGGPSENAVPPPQSQSQDIDKLASDIQQVVIECGDVNVKPSAPSDVVEDGDGIRVKAVNHIEQREAEDGWTLLNDQQPLPPTSTGAIPKTTATATASPQKGEGEERQSAKSASTRNPEIPSFYPEHVRDALHRMLAMGFSNEGNWLGDLLFKNNGDVGAILDLLLPAKRTTF